jgi:hypothetical protein
MKYSGSVFDFGNEAERFVITSAVIQTRHISIDWDEEDGDSGHLEATSSDGFYFEGNFGYPRPEPGYRFTLRKYSAKKNVLLYGTWSRDDGEGGIWIFALTLESATSSIRKRKSRAKLAKS